MEIYILYNLFGQQERERKEEIFYNNHIPVIHFIPRCIRNDILHIGVSRGGGGSGVLTPPFPGPPLFICDPPPTQPDLTDKCNVNCS